jgi:hypothetical protein
MRNNDDRDFFKKPDYYYHFERVAISALFVGVGSLVYWLVKTIF